MLTFHTSLWYRVALLFHNLVSTSFPNKNQTTLPPPKKKGKLNKTYKFQHIDFSISITILNSLNRDLAIMLWHAVYFSHMLMLQTLQPFIEYGSNSSWTRPTSELLTSKSKTFLSGWVYFADGKNVLCYLDEQSRYIDVILFLHLVQKVTSLPNCSLWIWIMN